MRKILLSHIFNEEYLLPWWLNYHKKYFDHGVIFDYNSTDRSRDIIKELCPSWEIISSVNTYFSAKDCDDEIYNYESSNLTNEWRICLNTTEFLIGNFNSLLSENNSQLLIPCIYFIDDKLREDDILYTESLFDHIEWGISGTEAMNLRRSRSLHNFKIPNYPLGRHFDIFNTDEFVIFNYGFAPMTDKFIDRKLQIQNKIPLSDKQRGFGTSHTNYGKGLTRDSLLDMFYNFKLQSKNVRNLMQYYLEKL